VLQCVAVCCSELQCVTVCCSVFDDMMSSRSGAAGMAGCSVLQRVAVCCSVLQSVAECCRVLQCFKVCCDEFWCVTVCYSVFHDIISSRSGVAEMAGCSVLQCVAVSYSV